MAQTPKIVSAVESAKAELEAMKKAAEERSRLAAKKGLGERNVAGRTEVVDVSLIADDEIAEAENEIAESEK